jgi:uncharacterized protein (TIRG00374 family)
MSWTSLRGIVGDLNWRFVVLSIVLVLASHLINIVRWRYLLKPWAVAYRKLVQYYGAGLFSNNFLPTGIGGDGVRVALVRQDVPLSKAIVSVGLDRALGLLGLLVLGIPALWFGIPAGLTWAPGSSRVVWQTLATALIVLGVCGLLGIVAWRRVPSLRRNGMRLRSRLFTFFASAQLTAREWITVLVPAALLSVISQLLLVATHWAVVQALGIAVSPGAVLWLVLVVSLALFLPITMNGLGLQEGIYVLLLASYGVQNERALGVALLMRCLMLLFSLLGGLSWLGWNAAGSAERRRADTRPAVAEARLGDHDHA